jgi:hypothetical protein
MNRNYREHFRRVVRETLRIIRERERGKVDKG